MGSTGFGWNALGRGANAVAASSVEQAGEAALQDRRGSDKSLKKGLATP